MGSQNDMTFCDRFFSVLLLVYVTQIGKCWIGILFAPFCLPGEQGQRLRGLLEPDENK